MVTREINIDLLPGGSMFGIEFLNAEAQLEPAALVGRRALAPSVQKTRPALG